jgi:lipoate-protein ligase A
MKMLGAKIESYKADKLGMQEKQDMLRTEMAAITHQISLLDAKIEALEEVFAEQDSSRTDVPGKPFKSLRDAMDDILKTWNGPFTRQQMTDLIRAQFPGVKFSDRGIETPITDLENEGAIEMIVRGNAKRPSVYIIKQKELTM